jgi:malate dehydrogenase (oxaloacetate-decarboxylating)
LFPGILRELIDAGTNEVSDDVLASAAIARVNIIGREELNPSHIIPSVFNPGVAKVEAAAVRTAAIEARKPSVV